MLKENKKKMLFINKSKYLVQYGLIKYDTLIKKIFLMLWAFTEIFYCGKFIIRCNSLGGFIRPFTIEFPNDT